MWMTKKIYDYVISPFNIIAFLIVIFGIALEINSIVNSTELSLSPTDSKGEKIRIETIEIIDKKIELSKDIIIKEELNPFTIDHKDWIVAENTEKKQSKESNGLNLEVKGIMVIGSKIKAIVQDLDTKTSKSIFISTSFSPINVLFSVTVKV